MIDSKVNPFGGGIKRGPTAASHFTIVTNAIARGPKLRFFDKGLLLNLLSHRAGFRITEQLLADQSGDSVKAIRAGLNRLRELGYVYRSPQPLRHPPGTRNAAGKLIGGAVAGYEWSVTDQPEVIAEILAQYAKEQHAAAAAELVLVEPESTDLDQALDPVDNPGTDDPADPVEDLNLTAESTGSADQAEHGVIPGDDCRSIPPGGIDRAREDQPHKTKHREDQGPGVAGDAYGAPDALRLSGPDSSTATGQGGPDPMDHLTGDHLNARAVETDSGPGRSLRQDVRPERYTPPVPPAPTRARARPTRRQQRATFARLDPAKRAELREQHQAATATADTGQRRAAMHAVDPQQRALDDTGRG